MLICDAATVTPEQKEALIYGTMGIFIIMICLVIPAALTIWQAKKKGRVGFGIVLAIISTLCLLLWNLLGFIVAWSSCGIMFCFGKSKKAEECCFVVSRSKQLDLVATD